MAIKKGDLVKVIELEINDAEEYGIKEGKTYKVVNIISNEVYISAGKGHRVMYNHQIEKVKKKSKKDLRIEAAGLDEDNTVVEVLPNVTVLKYITELESKLEQIQNILNN